jgi:RNA polymerase sigma-70 factor (ECF subfamily)
VPDDPRTDQQLIAALNRADFAAFAPLYERHKDWVYRLATRYTGEHNAALDVVQEAFAYLLAQFPGFKLTARLTTYLYPVVKNIALSGKRRSKRLKFGEVPEPAEVVPEFAMPEGELGAVLAGLPAGQLEVLLMRVVDGMSVEEVAAALGIAEGTVKSRLHLVLERLRGDERARKWIS